MKKTLVFLLTLFSVCLISVCGLCAEADRVFDNADLFTEFEIQQITERISSFQHETGMDFVVLTNDIPHDNEISAIADDFYDENNFGLDEDKSGVLYYIDMSERWHYLSTTGAMIDYLTDSRIDTLIDTATPYLSASSYADGVIEMINHVQKYIDSGIPEGQFRYDVLTGKRYTSRHKVLTSSELFISAVISAVVMLIFVFCVKARYSLAGSTYSYDFTGNTDVSITAQKDQYIRTTVTRIKKPDPRRFSGSGGGGSGTHFGSSGTSHGGGGGSF